MTAREKTLWEQAVRVLRQNSVTVEASSREKRVLAVKTPPEQPDWQRRAV